MGPSRPATHGSGSGSGSEGNVPRKDSAADSNKTSPSEVPKDKVLVEDAAKEPAMFRLDEEVQTLHDALLRNCNLEPGSKHRRIRSCSDPEVHMDEAHDTEASGIPIRRQSTRLLGTYVSAREDLYNAGRCQLDLPSLDEMVARDHSPGLYEARFKRGRPETWKNDRNSHDESQASHEQHAGAEAERQRDRDRANLEERIRSQIEDDQTLYDTPNPSSSDRVIPDFETVQTSWAAYMHDWFQVLQLDHDCKSEELYSKLPRPVLGSDLRSLYREELAESFERDVADLFRNMPGGQVGDRTEYRRKLKGEVARWHPDKLAYRFSSARRCEKVMELATRVTQVITLLIARA